MQKVTTTDYLIKNYRYCSTRKRFSGLLNDNFEKLGKLWQATNTFENMISSKDLDRQEKLK